MRKKSASSRSRRLMKASFGISKLLPSLNVCGDDFADEGTVSGRVGEEEAEPVPFAAHVCGVDAGVLFLLVRREVGNAGFRIDGTETVDGFRLVEHEVAERGFSAAAVSGHDEIADLFRFKFHHTLLLLFLKYHEATLLEKTYNMRFCCCQWHTRKIPENFSSFFFFSALEKAEK